MPTDVRLFGEIGWQVSHILALYIPRPSAQLEHHTGSLPRLSLFEQYDREARKLHALAFCRRRMILRLRPDPTQCGGGGGVGFGVVVGGGDRLEHEEEAVVLDKWRSCALSRTRPLSWKDAGAQAPGQSLELAFSNEFPGPYDLGVPGSRSRLD